MKHLLERLISFNGVAQRRSAVRCGGRRPVLGVGRAGRGRRLAVGRCGGRALAGSALSRGKAPWLLSAVGQVRERYQGSQYDDEPEDDQSRPPQAPIDMVTSGHEADGRAEGRRQRGSELRHGPAAANRTNQDVCGAMVWRP